jgi:hypothetical protein
VKKLKKEVRKMNVKSALLTLLVILAATTIFAATAAAFNEAPSITSIKTNLNEENSNYVSLVGDPKGGGWPQVARSL